MKQVPLYLLISFLHLSNFKLVANPMVLHSKSTLTVIELDEGERISFINPMGIR